MNSWTRIGLILLRVTIGWHFLFEGIEKLESWNRGPAEGQPVWSAEGYLREAQGPLAWWFRQQAGDLDADALAKLTFPAEPGKLSPDLEMDWRKQFDRFAAYYDLGKTKSVQPEFVGALALSPIAPFPAAIPWPALARGMAATKDDQWQKTLAAQDVEQARQIALTWFAKGNREVPSKLPGVSEKIKESTGQRIEKYRKNLDKLAEMENDGMPGFDRDVFKDNYRLLKAETAKLRTELMKELYKPFNDAMAVASFRLANSQREGKPAVPDPNAGSSNLDRINFVTRWGVTIVGACLIAGFFTRTACVGGAAFLLMFYLAMPSLPWLPVNPRAEGHYYYINKNIIEMVALLTLATTQSGTWLGLDGLLQFLNPFRSSAAPKRVQVSRQTVGTR
jgi:uncharacterized membrane protein YphA (DoxX/SURF4 family)